jgi:uncharacterized protein (TIGR03000 family)
MYSMVLMLALSGSAELPDCHGGRHGCRGGGYGGCYGGCRGGCYGGGCRGGCYGGCYGGGCYGGGCYGGGCYGGGCYGGMSYGGCYGGGCYGGMSHGGCYGGGVIVVPAGTAPAGTRKTEGEGGTIRTTPPKQEEQGAIDRPAPATLVVTLPADAILKVDGNRTTSTSSFRRFVTPDLDPGKDFYYSLEAEVVSNGRTEILTKNVTVRAGLQTQVNFNPGVSTARAR